MPDGYGLSGTAASTRATPDAGDDVIEATTTGKFRWPTYRKKCFVEISPAATATLSVRFGAEDAAANNWDTVLKATHERRRESPDGMQFNVISIYSTAQVTIGTDFDVRGWD